MPVAKMHDQANCPGQLVRVYERVNRAGALRPLGYVCDVCRLFIPDEDPLPMKSISELRPAAEAVASELSGLLWERRVHERVAGIVRSNPRILAKAQSGNPYLNGVRRWWATASALTVRRHVDRGTQGSLRWILERLVELDEGTPVLPNDGASPHRLDLERLETISVRLRPYFNAMIHGVGVSDASSVTFIDLLEAIDAIAEIGERTYVAITNISRRLEPIEQFEWTDIFQEPWILSDEQPAYILGQDGVPYDALPMTLDESANVGRVKLSLVTGSLNEVVVSAVNDSEVELVDVRVFLPYLRTVIDVSALAAKRTVDETISWRETSDPKFGWGQAVIEFCDVNDNVYRQYADVDFIRGTVRKLTRAYHVQGRIVAPRPYVVL